METQVRGAARPAGEILKFCHPKVVERHAVDHNVAEEVALRRFEGLKQFMAVAALTPGRKVASPAVDAMWHSFLLYTKDYREFCQEYLGRFIEHEPFETAAPWAYDRTRQEAESLFGPLDGELWPAEAKADCSSGCDGD